jgi:hypothetical protein
LFFSLLLLFFHSEACLGLFDLLEQQVLHLQVLPRDGARVIQRVVVVLKWTLRLVEFGPVACVGPRVGGLLDEGSFALVDALTLGLGQ